MPAVAVLPLTPVLSSVLIARCCRSTHPGCEGDYWDAANRVCGAYRGSGRVQSAPGEPAGWSPGAGQPLIPVAGRNGALENLRSITSATYLPPAISALVAACGHHGHGSSCPPHADAGRRLWCSLWTQLCKPASHVLPAGNSKRISTTSASESTIFPLYPGSDWGSLHGAAPAVTAPVTGGASPPKTAVRGKTGEITGHGGSRTTANGHLCAILSPEKVFYPLMHPPYISELH